MPMIDIELPFNHSHIVTWLDPSKMAPTSGGGESSSSKRKLSIFNIRHAPMYPVVQTREMFLENNPDFSLLLPGQVRTTSSSRSKRGIEVGSHAGSWSPNHFCGGNFTDMSGLLRSPGYPLYYPHRKVTKLAKITKSPIFKDQLSGMPLRHHTSGKFHDQVLMRRFWPPGTTIAFQKITTSCIFTEHFFNQLHRGEMERNATTII